MDKFVEENPGIPFSSVTLEMWKHILVKENLTDENKTEDEIKAAEAKYREVYLDSTYQPDEVKNVVAVVDNSNNFVPLIGQIAMVPEVGGSLRKNTFLNCVRLLEPNVTKNSAFFHSVM